eukprot:NODE_1570_length_844_cov_285.571069_g1220_i0.p1 GENE.NODE_1570_length_844_cov_285.571069_g1220_i0~~NODE_1570_length_844_cov_285.571069_g1220_i0.p1  ORF type:complete len:239 (-),score=33.25 NODE_1570_length_844_cov_285.571069_g1220_i0:71-787(-)
MRSRILRPLAAVAPAHAAKSGIAGFAAGGAIQTVTGLAAPVISIGLYVSPLKIAQEIRVKKSTGQYSVVPYGMMFANCSLWTDYALQINNMSVFAPNSIGMALSLTTAAIFLKYSDAAQTAKVQQTLGGGALALGLLLGYVHTLPTSILADQLGTIASVVCVAMFASPLITIKEVVQTKNSASLPLPLIVMGNLNCAAWMVYGLCLNNVYIYGPNALGLTLSLIQLMACLVYPKKVSA